MRFGAASAKGRSAALANRLTTWRMRIVVSPLDKPVLSGGCDQQRQRKQDQGQDDRVGDACFAREGCKITLKDALELKTNRI